MEDHETQVYGIKAILSETEDMELVAAGSTVDQLLAITTELDLAVLDLRLGDGSSPGTNVERLRGAGIETLVLTSAEEPFLVRSAAKASVLGVLRKSVSAQEFTDAVRRAARGEQVATMDWAAAIDSDPEVDAVKLSPRQRQVLELYAAGEPAARVAAQTGLSLDTVNLYLGRIRQKYAAAGRPAPTKTDLYMRAVEDGWLPMPRLRRRK